MTDQERLTMLLTDLFPVVSRSWWPFTVEQAAEALVRYGVTFADGLAATRNLGVEEAIARCQQMLATSEAAADREITRLRGLLADDELRVGLVLGLTIDELRVAVATADQYHPQWRSSQKPASSQGG